MRRLSAALLALLPLSILPACSSFDQHWMATQPQPFADPAAPLAGKWEGQWGSDATAFHGLYQALVVPTQSVYSKDGVPSQQYHLECQQCLYDILRNDTSFIVTATVAKDGKVHFEGTVDRGIRFGGLYHYDGYVENDQLVCDFTSARDSGTLVLHRITLETQPK